MTVYSIRWILGKETLKKEGAQNLFRIMKFSVLEFSPGVLFPEVNYISYVTGCMIMWNNRSVLIKDLSNSELSETWYNV